MNAGEERALTTADKMQLASLILSSLSLVVVVVVSWVTVGIGRRTVELAQQSVQAATTGVQIAETEAAVRRLERIGELVVQTHLVARTAKTMGWSDNKEVVDLQVRLSVALTGLEDRLPRANEMAWTESKSPAGVGQVERLWRTALDEVVRALTDLQLRESASPLKASLASDAEASNH